MTVDPQVAVAVTAPEGVFLYKTSGAPASVPVTAGSNAVVLNGSGNVFVYATKPGLHTIKAAAGSTEKSWNIYVGVKSAAVRTVTVDEAARTQKPNSFANVSGKVVDFWGNPVAGAVLDVALAGASSVSPTAVTSTATGAFTTIYTASTATGTARVAFTVQSAYYIPGTYAGYPDGVDEAHTDITVTDKSDKTIVIAGVRGTVSGKPGVVFTGETTGFGKDAKMKPWVRFPGQTEYTLGTARPTTDVAGDFTWQRKTGKKIYVYFTSEDDAVKSNRVIVDAK